MGSTLSANILSRGMVRSDPRPKAALHRHRGKLDSIALGIGVALFDELCDTEIRPSQRQEPAAAGVWLDAQEALRTLTSLLAEIESRRIRFGLLHDEHAEVVTELRDAIAFAKQAEPGDRFNFTLA